MTLKKLLWPALCCMMALSVACSSDDASPTTPGGGGEGEGGGAGGNSWTSGVSLATSANADVARNMYNTWSGFHYVTLDAEAAYYGSISSDFGVVFNGFSPVGRVIWSTQTTGAYRNHCRVEGTTNPSMEFRGCTVSEGVGYGMLLSYFQGDNDVFTGLWNYSRGLRAYFNTPFTPWITYNFHYNQIDASSATDADLDVATSLILMHYKTGNQEYLNDALTIVNAIWNNEIEASTKLILSGNTAMWSNNPTYNLSYFSPVAIRLFAAVDSGHDWNGVLDAMYAYMKKVQDGGTGVFPDWSDASGVAKKAPNGSSDKTYWLFNKESVRIPWRIAWDYYWYQDPRAKEILDKLNGFIVEKSGGNPENAEALGTSYSWNKSAGEDQAGGGTIPNQWLGAWCVTGLSGNADWLNACTAAVNARVPSNTGSSYFSDILLTMYSQLLNGLYVRPF